MCGLFVYVVVGSGGQLWALVLQGNPSTLPSAVYLRAYYRGHAKLTNHHEINLDGGGCGRCASDVAPKRCTGLRGSASRNRTEVHSSCLSPSVHGLIGAWCGMFAWSVRQGHIHVLLAYGRFAAKAGDDSLTTFLSVRIVLIKQVGWRDLPRNDV